MINSKARQINQKFNSVRGEKSYKINQAIELVQELTSESLEGFDPDEMIATKNGLQKMTELLRAYIEQGVMKFRRYSAEFEASDIFDSAENNTDAKQTVKIKKTIASEGVRTGKRGRPANQPGTNKYCVLRAIEENGAITLSEIQELAQILGKQYDKNITATQVKQTINGLVSQKNILNKNGRYSIV